jgi:hypothetical protein
LARIIKLLFPRQSAARSVFFVKYSPENQPCLEPVKKSTAYLRLMNAQIGRAEKFDRSQKSEWTERDEHCILCGQG